jgi:hypothetical protein
MPGKKWHQTTALERLQAKQAAADEARAADPLNIIMARLRSPEIDQAVFSDLAATAYRLIEMEEDDE